MKKFVFYLFIAIVGSLGASLCFIATPLYLGKAIDLMGHDIQGVVQFLGVALSLYIIYALLSMLTQIASSKAGIVYTESLRAKIIGNLEKVSLTFLDTNSHGYLLSVFTNDSQLFQDGLVQFITQGLQGVFTVVIAAGFMIQIDFNLSLVVFVTIPVMFLSSYLVNKYSSAKFKQQQRLNAELNDVLTEIIENDEYVSSNAYEEDVLRSFSKANDELNNTAEKAQFLSALVNPTTRLVNNLSYMLIGLLGSFIIVDKGISIGVLTSFISYSVMFSKPLNEFSAVFTDVSLGLVAYGRIQSLLEVPLQSDVETEIELEGKSISLQDVSFSYQEEIPALDRLNLEIKPLSKVAIVGPTGSGKSTLINLLLRYYDVNSGSILIDGVNVDRVSRHSVRKTMGVVMQEPWLFRGSIIDNLRYGNESSSFEEVVDMCHKVGCYDFIHDMDDGFDSIVGTVSMSQGQKQMLTIVRALLTQAPILLLDEATSNIDVVSESVIQKTLTEVMKTHTSFFVAHRLQTIVNSDVILVMKEGQLIEVGTHVQLMNQAGFYSELVSAQME